MKKIGLVALAVLMPLSAYAASATDPVNRIIDIAKARWDSTENNAGDYFDKLDRDFSAAFAKTYKAATKYPAYDGGDSPFDYDVITSSQDGCPLKDIKIEGEAEKDGVTIVDVSFKLWTCVQDEASKKKVEELKFDVITENGKTVIDDIHTKGDDGKWGSLVSSMKEIIKSGQQQQ